MVKPTGADQALDLLPTRLLLLLHELALKIARGIRTHEEVFALGHYPLQASEGEQGAHPFFSTRFEIRGFPVTGKSASAVALVRVYPSSLLENGKRVPGKKLLCACLGARIESLVKEDLEAFAMLHLQAGVEWAKIA